jgi:hypothetical protein
MTKGPRTTLLSVAAVAIAAIVLGSEVRAQAVPTAPQAYLRFLRKLPSAATAISLLQRYNTLERTLNILTGVPSPGAHQLQRIASLSNQEMVVYSAIQNNIRALLTSEAVLQSKYLAQEAQVAALLAAGRVFQARQVAIQAGQTSNVMNSVQSLVAAERGVATPVR